MTKTIIDLKKLYDASVNKQQWLAHTAPEKFILFGGAWGGGKTAWLVNEAIGLSVTFPGNVGFIGCRDGTDFRHNALGQLLKFLPPNMYAPYKNKEGILVARDAVHHKTDQYIKLINGSVIMYGGIGNETESEQKINNMPSLGWVAIDQAEELSENQFLRLDSRIRLPLNGIKYKFLMTANPDPGWLRDRFIEHSYPDHRFIASLPGDNPFLPKGYVDEKRGLYPEDMVRRMLEGDWDIPGTNYLFPYDRIRAAVSRDMPPAGVKVAGVDISREGDDQTVFLVRQGNKVLDIVSWSHQLTTFSAGKVADLIREHKPFVTNIDIIGIGAGVFDPLYAEGYNVRQVNVGEQASKPDIYLNKRAEYYKNLAKRFEMGEIDIPDHAQLASELASIKYDYRNTRFVIESKKVAKKRGVKSPDFADALMLAFIPSGASREISVYRRGVRVG